MPRTITVSDDDTGVQARVVVVHGDAGQEITHVELSTTTGRGLRAQDLLILADLGLPMPTPAARVLEPAVEPVLPAVARSRSRQRLSTSRQRVDAARDRAEKTRSERGAASGRLYRLAPPEAELVRLFTQFGGIAAVAAHLGVPYHTVSGWRKRMIRDGVEFPPPLTVEQHDQSADRLVDKEKDGDSA